MKTRCYILTFVLLICVSCNLSWANAGSDKVKTAVEAWLSLVDSENYADSWKNASSYFQTAIAEQQWVTSLTAVRKPLGTLSSRRMMTSQASTHLPGAPDGNYMVMTFETSFEHKKSAIETVTFMLDNDGQWKAAGYFIK